MKKTLVSFCLFACLLVVASSTSSCNRKVGCPAYESAHVKPNKKGNLPMKRGNSSLFPKKMRKRK